MAHFPQRFRPVDVYVGGGEPAPVSRKLSGSRTAAVAGEGSCRHVPIVLVGT